MSIRDLVDWGNVCGRHGISTYQAILLRKCAVVVERYNVNQCNRQVTERETARAERAKDQAREIVEAHGFTLITGGDPRGYALKVLFGAEGPYNTWGGAEEGYGIPTT